MIYLRDIGKDPKYGRLVGDIIPVVTSIFESREVMRAPVAKAKSKRVSLGKDSKAAVAQAATAAAGAAEKPEGWCQKAKWFTAQQYVR